MATSEEQFEYDVFLSYNRSERDAGSFFPQHLHDVLNRKGIRSHKYSEDLEVGEEIAPATAEAIQASRIVVVILSRHYASSASCLSELVKTLQLNNLIGRRVMPLFYGIEPSWVRRQRASYHEAMVEHESRYGSSSEKVRQWREALAEIGDMRGWILTAKRGEAESIQRVAGDIGIALQQLKAPTAPEASRKHSKWPIAIGKLMFIGLVACAPSIALLTSGHANDFPLGMGSIFIFVNISAYLIFAARYLRNVARQNTA